MRGRPVRAACCWPLNRGSELFEVGADGPRLARAPAGDTGEKTRRSTRAADDTVARLAARGLEAQVVSQRLNRRKIDLIPLPEWADPPKARIDELLAAVAGAAAVSRDQRPRGGRRARRRGRP